jgi:hypothetical protein
MLLRFLSTILIPGMQGCQTCQNWDTEVGGQPGGEGLDLLYNKMHDLVKADSVKNGCQFNQKLGKAITERCEQDEAGEKETAEEATP